jgi:hemerythrin-like domain-containing protein
MLGAGGLAAGAAGAGIALAATSSGPAATTAQLDAVAAQLPPTEDLMREHGLLLRLLLIYRDLTGRVQAAGPLPAGHLHDAALIIHDYIEGFHEPLEEGYVFPRLVQARRLRGTPASTTVSTLLLQHARGRQQTQLILAETAGSGPDSAAKPAAAARLAGAMGAFVRMYEPHEAREDTVIYPAFRTIVSAQEIVDLGRHFADLEREQFGPAGFTEMVSKVAGIEQALGLYDLTQFTPANLTPPG